MSEVLTKYCCQKCGRELKPDQRITHTVGVNIG